MDSHGYTHAYPHLGNVDMPEQPAFNLQSGYVLRSLDVLPKSGTRRPWALTHNYLRDVLGRRLRVHRGLDGVRPGGYGVRRVSPVPSSWVADSPNVVLNRSARCDGLAKPASIAAVGQVVRPPRSPCRRAAAESRADSDACWCPFRRETGEEIATRTVPPRWRAPSTRPSPPGHRESGGRPPRYGGRWAGATAGRPDQASDRRFGVGRSEFGSRSLVAHVRPRSHRCQPRRTLCRLSIGSIRRRLQVAGHRAREPMADQLIGSAAAGSAHCARRA